MKFKKFTVDCLSGAFIAIFNFLSIRDTLRCRRVCREWNDRITTWPLLHETFIVRDCGGHVMADEAEKFFTDLSTQLFEELPRLLAAASGHDLQSFAAQNVYLNRHLFEYRRVHATVCLALYLPHITATLMSLRERLLAAAPSSDEYSAILENLHDRLMNDTKPRQYGLQASQPPPTTGWQEEVNMILESLRCLRFEPPDSTTLNERNFLPAAFHHHHTSLPDLASLRGFRSFLATDESFVGPLPTPLPNSNTALQRRRLLRFRVATEDIDAYMRLRNAVRRPIKFHNNFRVHLDGIDDQYDGDDGASSSKKTFDDEDDDEENDDGDPNRNSATNVTPAGPASMAAFAGLNAEAAAASHNPPRLAPSYFLPDHIVADVAPLLIPLFQSDIARGKRMICTVAWMNRVLDPAPRINRLADIETHINQSLKQSRNAAVLTFAMFVASRIRAVHSVLAWLFSVWGFSALHWCFRVLFPFEIRVMVAEQRFPWPTWQGSWQMTRISASDATSSPINATTLGLAAGGEGEEGGVVGLVWALMSWAAFAVMSPFSLLLRFLSVIVTVLRTVCHLPIDIVETFFFPLLGIDVKYDGAVDVPAVSDFPWRVVVCAFVVAMLLQVVAFARVNTMPSGSGSPFVRPPFGFSPIIATTKGVFSGSLICVVAWSRLVVPAVCFAVSAVRFLFGWTMFNSSGSAGEECYNALSLIGYVITVGLLIHESMTPLNVALCESDQLHVSDWVSSHLGPLRRIRTAERSQLLWIPLTLRDASSSSSSAAAAATRERLFWVWRAVIRLREMTISLTYGYLLMTRYIFEAVLFATVVMHAATLLEKRMEKRRFAAFSEKTID